MSKTTGRLRKSLSYSGAMSSVKHTARDVKYAWKKGRHMHGAKAAYKRKRYYKRNLNFKQ